MIAGKIEEMRREMTGDKIEEMIEGRIEEMIGGRIEEMRESNINGCKKEIDKREKRTVEIEKTTEKMTLSTTVGTIDTKKTVGTIERTKTTITDSL